MLFRTFWRTFPCLECRQLHRGDFLMPPHAPLLRSFGALNLLQTWGRFFWGSSVPLYPFCKEENHIEPKSFEVSQERDWVTELMKISTASNIPFQLLVCVLHFLFCGVLSLQLWHLAFSISFDLLNLGSEDSLRPLFSGSAFKYLLIECRNLVATECLSAKICCSWSSEK